MEIICGSCQTNLAIPDASVPKEGVVTGTCPNCKQPVQISAQKEPAPAVPAAAPPAPEAAAPPPPPPAAQAPAAQQPAPQAAAAEVTSRASAAPSPSGLEAGAEDEESSEPQEEFVEGARLAMACFEQPELAASVTAELQALGYAVHNPRKASEAVRRLRQKKYEVLILHDAYGASAEGNPVLKVLQPMAMSLRRHMCVGLVGPKYRTFDNMMALAQSVNFVVSERELDKIKVIIRQAVTDNDQFYHVFREAVRDAGKS